MQTRRIHWTIAAGPYIVTALLGLAMTLAVVQSVARSNWTNFGLDALSSIALGGLLVGGIFGMLRWLPGALAHLLAGVLGLTWVVSRIGPYLGEGLLTWRDQATELLIRSIILGRLVRNGGQGDDVLLFIAVLGLLSYVLGYTTLWMLLRRGLAWWVVLLNAGVLLINLTYASPKPPAALFFLFVGASLLVLVHQTYQARAQTWEAALLEYPDLLGWRVVAWGAMVAVLVMLLTTLLPTRITSAQVAHVWQRVRDPWQDVQSRWDRTFSTINAPANAVGGGFSSRSLTLSGPRSLGNRLIMEVSTGRYDYWRAVAFDRYDGTLSWLNTTGDLARATLGLSSSELARTPLAAGAEMPLLDTLGRRTMTQTFTLRQDLSFGPLFSATQPVSVSLPILVEHTYLVSNDSSVANFMDTSTIVSQRPLRAGSSYTVESMVSAVDKASLRAAPTEYSDWVQRYLQLPATLPQRVRDEAQRVVREAGATNVYDKAEAIQASLRTLPYDEKIPFPPDNRDGVDYFLFELRRGYCDYFAAAMVVMLRSEGIPTRLVSGYAGGVRNPETGRFEVRQNIAHTWPEVYFPGYGWQRFEPTPASYTALPQRAETPGDQAAQDEADASASAASDDALTDEELALLEREFLGGSGQPSLDAEMVIEATRQRAAQLRRQTLLQRGAFAAAVGGLLLIGFAVRRRSNQLPPAARVFERVLRMAHWSGIGPAGSATPEEAASQLARHLPAQRRPLQSVAAAYTEERYASAPTAGASTLEESWRALRWPLVGAIFARPWRAKKRTP